MKSREKKRRDSKSRETEAGEKIAATTGVFTNRTKLGTALNGESLYKQTTYIRAVQTVICERLGAFVSKTTFGDYSLLYIDGVACRACPTTLTFFATF